ncbi:DUF2553 family protein [Ammoniphilus resinae]|uniref:DUF2553 family protein n=1 Tax=Ammoniphilus resinae TaxID=861532 RepID=A0ABS4GWM4_9BACL|nr:DUF2553 family protein [Ammoniphilus resinae]MBP1934646.1 hypothetical protein [Ammoniphilus resinae]
MSDARIDITGRIRGELKDNTMMLTYNGVPIGYVPFDASCVQMDDGFVVDDQKIFRLENADLKPPGQYVDCDGQDGHGWC